MTTTYYRFFKACYDNNVSVVREMVSEGVDINVVMREGVQPTALLVATSEGNTEVVRLLLDCNNIKLDKTDNFGHTALHKACLYNNVECLQLLLRHISCTKDIVRMKNNRGDTAEMLAFNIDNQVCARLVRKYLENVDGTVVDDGNNMGDMKCNQECAAKDDRSIDELVEFINGKTDKKKRKKRSNAGQSVPAKNTGTTPNIELLNVNHDNIEIKTTDDSYTLEKTEVGIMDDCGKDQNSNNAKYTDLIELNKVKIDLEGKIAEKRLQFVTNQQKAGDVIQTKSGQIKNITMNIEKSQNDANKLDNQLKELESKMKDLKQKCPMCLEVAASPILMCSEQHLICSSCRPKVSQCPECREWYTGKDRRHRYAEKTREELERLREKKDQVIVYSS